MSDHSMQHHRRAFSLIELVVVIGIIAILAALLLPSLSAAWRHAKRVQCMSNLHQIGLAYLMYANDNHGDLPCFLLPVDTGNGTTKLGAINQWGPFIGNIWTADGNGVMSVDDPTAFSGDAQRLLLPKPYGLSGVAYLKNNDVYFCPGDDVRRPERSPVTHWAPYDFDNALDAMSYYAWYQPVTDYRGHPEGVATDPDLANGSLKVSQPSRKALIADQGWIIGGNDAPPLNHTIFFHRRGWNVLYVDGHVKWVNRVEVEKYMHDPYNDSFRTGGFKGFCEAGG